MFRYMLHFVLACLYLSTNALAVDVRIAVPAAYSDDLFLEKLTTAKELADAGIKLIPEMVETEGDAMRLVKKGDADLAIFTLAAEDQKQLKQAGGEAQILTRPFIFKSVEEVFLMQSSFLGSAAATDAGRTGLFPLRIWNHAITYLLSKDPVRNADDLARLAIVAEDGSPESKIFSAVGAKTMDGTMSDMHGQANAFETQLSDATLDFISKYEQKLYLLVGWPVTGVIASGPDFWLKRSVAEKAAFTVALTAAADASRADLMAREAAARAKSNVEFVQLDQQRRSEIAMMAAGSEAPQLVQEMRLWKRAEEEVHAKVVPVAAPKAAAPKLSSPTLFATDRNDEKTDNLATRFGARRLETVEFNCGVLGVSKPISGEPKLPAAPVESVKGSEACAQLIVKSARAAGMKKVLFIIHGFNTTFEALSSWVLKLGSDLDYEGAIVGWSWPSEGSAFSYAYDEDSNSWSEPHFAELVSNVAAAGPELQLDFAAHSMGNRILVQMLRELSLVRANFRIGAITFVAPDVAQDLFREQLRAAQKFGIIRTLYASEYDYAINISESYHGAPRAGSGGASLLLLNGVESVDVKISGHSSVFEDKVANHDFRKVINEATVAAARGLEKREKDNTPYWVIAPKP